MATEEHVRAKELSTRQRGQLGNWLFTGYGDREEKTPLAKPVPKVGSGGGRAKVQGTASEAGAAEAQPSGPHQRSGSAEARSYQARNRGNIGDIMGLSLEQVPVDQPPSPTASRASTAVTESDVQSEAPSEARSHKSGSSSAHDDAGSVVAASEVPDVPSPVESHAESVVEPDVPASPQHVPQRARSAAEEYALRNKGTMDSTFGEASPRPTTATRVKGNDARSYADRNRGQLTQDQYSYGQEAEVISPRPHSARRQQDNMAGILTGGTDNTDSGPAIRSPRNAEARAYKDRNRGTMADVLGGSGSWEMPKRSLAHDSYGN